MKIATWVRPKDAPYFQPWFAQAAGLEVFNAQEKPADLAYANGLLLTGGGDIAAEHLRQPVSDPSLVRDTEPERDAWELAALKQALERGLPVLAICRGFQLLNVALGGTLHLDIPGHADPDAKDANVQKLRHAKNGSFQFEAVNSSHHQALATPAPHLQIEAWHAKDDVIEQGRWTQAPFVFGVQYHPERHPVYQPLFDAFFQHVREHSQKRVS